MLAIGSDTVNNLINEVKVWKNKIWHETATGYAMDFDSKYNISVSTEGPIPVLTMESKGRDLIGDVALIWKVGHSTVLVNRNFGLPHYWMPYQMARFPLMIPSRKLLSLWGNWTKNVKGMRWNIAV